MAFDARTFDAEKAESELEEYICDECGRHITVTLSGKELGHADAEDGERCPNRPTAVDTKRGNDGKS